ncbi:HEAT repeat domain-containing protein [Vitiosangium sp. GDMCC 1.1324]|uniref:HEAT repeat domain-containing protein n=1 Tax=Vitiosangium sp. (strain GDMCC 1.1324) TaxID=2138576 RepID=UPI000D3451AD|nr:HEAT repeat domain-containing protein [Vitiosangium sp. GDMCC 1.1324]PTL76516.1 hypothetical protein DAT35_48740 [Vitiosangium sp. GDMCC 1.1324]
MSLKAKHVVVASLATALLGSLAWVELDGGASVTAETMAPAARGELRFPWAEGVRHVYALTWSSRTGGMITPAQEGAGKEQTQRLLAETEVEGEVVVEGLGATPEGFRAAVSYGKLRRFSFKLQGRDAVEDEAKVMGELSGHPAFVTFNTAGEPVALAFEPTVPAATQSALRALVAQLHWTLPTAGATEWTAVERSAVGQASVRYLRDGDRLHRTPVAYESLDAVPGPALDGQQQVRGSALLSLDATGAPVSFSDQVELSYTRRGATEPSIIAGWTFTLERLVQERYDAAALLARAQTPARPLSQPVTDAELGARRDARLAQGVSVESLMLDIDHFEAGQRPAHALIVKAGAYLRLHPEADLELVHKFQNPELTLKGRGFVLDLLVQAGDGPAQAALRAALETPVAQEHSREFGLLVQRFSFVEAPEPESAEFIAHQFERARNARDVASAQGAAVALGSTVRRLAQMGREDAARQYGARLRDELAYTQEPGMQRGLLAALGNAARLEDVDAIRAYSGSEDPQVRDQVASSLRHLDTPAARETLLSLATDTHSSVASSAFASLLTQTMEPGDWSRLAEQVEAGKTPLSADAALLELVRTQRQSAGARGDAILVALLARNGGGDNDLGGIIRQMLPAQ